MPRYSLTSRQFPVSSKRLFMGRGFRWSRLHTQRLLEAQDPALARYVNQSAAYQWARRLEHLLEKAPRGLSLLPRMTAWDSPLNPVRPLPPVGGSPLLHGVEPNEQEASLPLGERVGHTLVLGTIRPPTGSRRRQ